LRQLQPMLQTSQICTRNAIGYSRNGSSNKINEYVLCIVRVYAAM
jgi:hypothetical protein